MLFGTPKSYIFSLLKLLPYVDGYGHNTGTLERAEVAMLWEAGIVSEAPDGWNPALATISTLLQLEHWTTDVIEFVRGPLFFSLLTSPRSQSNVNKQINKWITWIWRYSLVVSLRKMEHVGLKQLQFELIGVKQHIPSPCLCHFITAVFVFHCKEDTLVPISSFL